jgi:hypothetical protein
LILEWPTQILALLHTWPTLLESQHALKRCKDILVQLYSCWLGVASC